MKWLLHHRWPGNVRELENMVERAITLARGPVMYEDDLGVDLPCSDPGGLGARSAPPTP